MANMQEPIVHTTIMQEGKGLEVLLFDDLVIVFDEDRGVRVGNHQQLDTPHRVLSRIEAALTGPLTSIRSGVPIAALAHVLSQMA